MYAKPRLPDPVRTAAVRAVIIVALTLVQLMVAFFCSMAGVWLAFPMVLSTIASTVVATWAVLDVWITRQVWVQRYGVVSEPSSVARRRAAGGHRRPGAGADGAGPRAAGQHRPPVPAEGRPGAPDNRGAGVRTAASVPRPARPPLAEERERPSARRPSAPHRTAGATRRTAPGRGGGTSVSR